MNFGFGDEEVPPPTTFEPGIADAQCIDGALIVSEVRSEHYPPFTPGDTDYHIYDYNFFHMNLRANAEARTQAFLGAQAAASDPIDEG